MKILIDTHIFLWFLEGNRRLTLSNRQLIEDSNNQIFVSLATLWEIAIKTGLKKLYVHAPLEYLVPKEMVILDIQLIHLIQVQSLPIYSNDHKDPFDRLVISQAIVEDLFLMTDDDKIIENYPIKLIKN